MAKRRKRPGSKRVFSGGRLRAIREKRGLSQETVVVRMRRLAVALGQLTEERADGKFRSGTLSKWERGDSVPSYNAAALLAAVLEVGLEDFMG